MEVAMKFSRDNGQVFRADRDQVMNFNSQAFRADKDQMTVEQGWFQREVSPVLGNAAQNGHAKAEAGTGGDVASVFLEPAPMELECGAADPLKDPVFHYISDILMDEDVDERTCMFIDCSGYQAMAQELTQELTQIISDSSSSSGGTDPNKTVDDSWIDEMFLVDEATSELQHAEVSCEVNQTLPDEVVEKNLISFLGTMQSDIEQRSEEKPEVAAAASQQQRLQDEKVVEDEAAVRMNEFMCLKSLIVECTDFLKGPPTKDESAREQHPDFYKDLLPPPDNVNQVEAGLIRVVVEDSKAVENEKALRLEMHAKLVECAQAVSSDDMAKAYNLVNSIRDRVSAHGSGTERLAFYFSEALVARITGTGSLLYSAMTNNRPAMNEMLKAYSLCTRYSPNVRISHYFTNQTILDVSEGATRVHIVDYGILYGLGWPCLIKAFAERKGGPPHLRITGIDFPQPGFKPAERVEETGRWLADYAKQVGVPFEYHAVATSKWESVQPSTLFLRHDEVLVVNSYFRLRHLLDESVMVDSPRKLVLSRIRSMKPKLFTQSVINANYNTPFFLSRFREALSCYSTIFEAIDTAISPEHPERLLIEQSIMGREILNVVSCEGVERVERAETYKQWQSRTSKAGFEQLPLRPEIYAKSRAMLSTYHKGFGIGQDGNWLLIGWKETVLHAICSWKFR